MTLPFEPASRTKERRRSKCRCAHPPASLESVREPCSWGPNHVTRSGETEPAAASDSEIEDLDVPAGRNEDVRRLYVSMQNSDLVQIEQRLR